MIFQIPRWQSWPLWMCSPISSPGHGQCWIVTQGSSLSAYHVLSDADCSTKGWVVDIWVPSLSIQYTYLGKHGRTICVPVVIGIVNTPLEEINMYPLENWKLKRNSGAHSFPLYFTYEANWDSKRQNNVPSNYCAKFDHIWQHWMKDIITPILQVKQLGYKRGW